ncbi:cache domain-containing protein [Pseudomarimonas salicorniae]|uniref:Cache domain-containing protein n=1 Tax=Pseudomarimonas salicorniae TaxID=2933270 RepID=A0ABT0GES0_9GAMM|nr:hypothetical protein [Lysobacter sp. CAU 1642]MCK7593046.1 hypothetical protein [Lysobacter sp. CAU 1642]
MPNRLFFPLLLASSTVLADPADTLLRQAEAHYGEVGREQALVDFTVEQAFRDGDLYVFCVDDSHRMSASGGFPRMVGVDIDRFNVGGRSGLASFMTRKASQAGDEGRVEYAWLNPASGRIEQKSVIFRRFGQDVCGVGHYEPVEETAASAAS